MKRIISLICIAVVVVMMTTAALAAEVTLHINKTVLQAGDTVAASIRIGEDLKNLISFGMKIEYDESVFELDAENSSAVSALEFGNVRNGVIPIAQFREDSFELCEGEIAVLIFKAKGNITKNKNSEFNVRVSNCGTDMGGTIVNRASDVPVSVTVQKLDKPVSENYVVNVTEKCEAIYGEYTVSKISVSNTAAVTFNSYDLSIEIQSGAEFNRQMSSFPKNAAVSYENGILHIYGYGADIDCSNSAFEIAYTVYDDAQVKLVSSKIDISENAPLRDAPQTDCENSQTEIVCTGYPVKIDTTVFSGKSVAEKGEDYSFSALDKNYHYEIAATENGKTLSVTNHGDGSFTVGSVAGALEISYTKTPKTFNVKIIGDVASCDGDKAVYQTDYKFRLCDDLQADTAPGSCYSVDSVTIGEKEYLGYASQLREYTIAGKDIIGDIVITVSKTEIAANRFTVRIEGNGAGDAAAAESVVKGGSAVLTLTQRNDARYSVSAKMNGNDIAVTVNGNSYTVQNVMGNIVFTVTKTAVIDIATYEYLQLDGKMMYLVTVSGELEQNESYTYNGVNMYKSVKYNAYCFLVIANKNVDADELQKNVGVARASANMIDYSGDVNASGHADMTDALIVWEMFNAEHDSFEEFGMDEFLRADLNGDKTVDVTDAGLIILRGK